MTSVGLSKCWLLYTYCTLVLLHDFGEAFLRGETLVGHGATHAVQHATVLYDTVHHQAFHRIGRSNSLTRPFTVFQAESQYCEECTDLRQIRMELL